MKKTHTLFSRANHAFLISGVITLTAGFILMGNHTGSGLQDIYSFQKITLSPMLICAGYGLLILSIFKRS